MKKRIYFIILVLSVVFLTGCARTESDKLDSLAENQFYVYYLNSAKTELKSEVYTVDAGAENIEEIIDELFLAMSKPNNTKNSTSSVPANVVLLNRELTDNALSVYFSNEYSQLAASDEIMFRAAYVKTITQLPGVEYVSFYVNDQPLTDAMGNSVGMMSASDFVEETGKNINTMQWVSISLYYADSTGGKLVTEEIEVGYGKNASLEKVILEQLIKGPGDTAHARTIPDNVDILSVETKDGVCYVNFDSSFLYTATAAKPEVVIYSIVNSLCELSTVNKVQIAINGNSNMLFMNTVDLSKMFERNLNLLGTTK